MVGLRDVQRLVLGAVLLAAVLLPTAAQGARWAVNNNWTLGLLTSFSGGAALAST
jgi:hypothetical protein